MSTKSEQLIKALQGTDGQGVIIFKNSLPNSRFALKNGKECIFLNGEFATNSEAEITEIMEEIEAGNPHLYIDQDKLLIAKADLDPVEALKRKIIAEFVESQRGIQAGQSDYGNSKQGPLNISSSADVNAAASGSNSADAPAAGTAKIVVGSKA